MFTPAELLEPDPCVAEPEVELSMATSVAAGWGLLPAALDLSPRSRSDVGIHGHGPPGCPGEARGLFATLLVASVSLLGATGDFRTPPTRVGGASEPPGNCHQPLLAARIGRVEDRVPLDDSRRSAAAAKNFSRSAACLLTYESHTLCLKRSFIIYTTIGRAVLV